MGISISFGLLLLSGLLITATTLPIHHHHHHQHHHKSSHPAIPAARNPPPSNPPSPTPNPPPPPTPSKRRHPRSNPAQEIHPPLPPSPDAPTELQENALNNIVDALIGSSDFAGWAYLLSSSDPPSIPLEATFFVPSNDDVLNPAGVNFSPSLLLYHIVPKRLTFSDLQRLTPHTLLPTLLPSKYIVVTNNSPSNFTVDNSQVTLPDISGNAAFIMHGVEKVLDLSVYGGDGILQSRPENTNTASRQPLRKNPDYPGESSAGLKSGGELYASDGLIMVLVTLYYFLASKSLQTDY